MLVSRQNHRHYQQLGLCRFGESRNLLPDKLLERVIYLGKVGENTVVVVVAEWLRRWTRNPLGSPRAGSNPADHEELLSCVLALISTCLESSSSISIN